MFPSLHVNASWNTSMIFLIQSLNIEFIEN